ncbi:MAG: PKD domain-containing protein [Bacteroidetes bacterium]|nr:MAG: PKD domain-containing protein [Bacteroidota bacterium]REK04977.1 MAG: PKD domain-containing protein [Bacteroidota bacterium]REK36519.1 MAG: PKD domain-containing protein [Bacteroidota bacterium]
MGNLTLKIELKFLLPAKLALLILSVSFVAQGNPTASFTASQTAGCVPLSVQFSNTSTGATSYYWDLGNGNTSSLPNPSNTFTTPGTYTIRLIAYNSSGQSDTAVYTNHITVNGKPSASFTCPVTTSCLDNNQISFSNTSTGAVTYLWDFGDGTTSTQTNPVHSYNQSGQFTVTLIATNAFGCQDVRIQNQLVTIHPKPNANIGTNFTTACRPSDTFQFSNIGQFHNSWYWTFGDGRSSTLQNPSHIYSSPGTYNVNLIVTNTFGCSDTSDQPTVVNVESGNWGVFSSNVDSGCAPLTVTFGSINVNIASYRWDFGDGGTSTQSNPTYIYNTPGLYTVRLIMQRNDGCTDTVVRTNKIYAGAKPTASFTYQNSVGCGPLTVSFTNTSQNFVSCLWVFGDGNTSTATNPVHTYNNSGTFNVTLKTWGPSGCTKSIVYYNIVKVTRTRAMFSATPRIGCPPLNTQFTNLSPGSGLTYTWNFGDGTTSTAANPSHTYNSSGNFDVTLIVRDSLGCTDTLRKPSFIQTVNPAANYIPPPTTSGCAPLTTQFTDATAGSTAWLWNFGDGTTSTLQNPVHTYTRPGLYTVSLTTTSAGGGCTQTINNFSTFNVQGGYAGFTHSATTCPPWQASFVDTSLNAVSWFWDFGDGTTSTQQNPTHNFTRPGYHSVSLTITTSDGCSYTTMQSNSVYFTPFGANFYGITQGGSFPMPVQFYANSVGATGWLWDFGDGTTSTLENPLHIFNTYGNYNITLTITNGICTLFYDPPPFNFGAPDTTPVDVGNPGTPVEQRGCTPLSVTFTNKVPNSVSWNWDFGDGNTSTQQFPSHTYTTPGIFTVVLRTTDANGTASVLRMDSIVKVFGPRAGFSFSQLASCTNTQVTFTDTSLNASVWQWDFGDSTFSSLRNPVHVYNSGRPNYIVKQTVRDTSGCVSSISTSLFSNFVSPLIASETEICGRDTIHFFTSMQNFPSYLWNFGDGNTSTLPNPSHVYTSEGVFNVSLTITDASGCSQTFHITPAITVHLPVASFTSTGTQGCDKLNVLFTNTSQNADAYWWDFGDGTSSSLTNPLHPYMKPGKFDVSLTVMRGNCISKIERPRYISVDTSFADFSSTVTAICTPFTVQFNDRSVNAVSWSWDFGTGDTSNLQNPAYTFQVYNSNNIRLAIVDSNGCRDTVYYPQPAPLFADFTASIDSGCVPLQVTFRNNSANAVSYFWDFGDGNTSTQMSPSHIYTRPGNFDVMLIIASHQIYGPCYDTIIMPARINVKEPIADFSTPDLMACAPSLVNFTDLSVDADSWLWDFGDNTTSTNKNPSHIYNDPGIYTVSLIVKSNTGCSDTLVKQQYIHVLGPVTRFSASATEGCVPFNVSYTDQSQNAIDWYWNYGDGHTSITQNPQHTYQDTGIFTVSLVTTDTAGCNSYYELPQKIIVHPSPTALIATPDSIGCHPYAISFRNLSTGYTSSVWSFGDGNTSTLNNPQHTYQQPGNYFVTLVVSNSFGCTDTFRLSNPIRIVPTPTAAFTPSSTQGCSPLVVNFTNQTSNQNGSTYFWTFGNGYTSTSPNPVNLYTAPGFYDVSLTVTNLHGCSNTVTYTSLIHVLDTNPPAETKIYSVSVLNNTSVEIKWENNTDLDLYAYLIYRQNAHTGMFDVIHTERNVQNTNFALESSYTDAGLNTLLNSYTYKVQAIDICGNAIPLHRLKSHTTINVSSVRAGEFIRVSWTPYGGCPVSTYQIFRSAPGEEFQYLTTVPSDSLAHTDSTFRCPYPYSYKIMATDLCGTTYISYSDTSRTIPLNTYENQIVRVVRSTVIDNHSILTEWGKPTVQPENVAYYEIYRSTDNINYRYLTSVSSSQHDYIDYSVDVQNQSYYYKILVVNTCNINEDLSPLTNTIVLQGEMDEGRHVYLKWTRHKGWELGVEYYIIEKLDANGNWQYLNTVDGETTNFDYQE